MTLAKLLTNGEDQSPAIGAPDRSPMTYAHLRTLTTTIAEDFSRHGIGPNDRIAIVLPNGPEMATSFVATAATANTEGQNTAENDEDARP